MDQYLRLNPRCFQRLSVHSQRTPARREQKRLGLAAGGELVAAGLIVAKNVWVITLAASLAALALVVSGF
jgi:uncharacterized membrane protein